MLGNFLGCIQGVKDPASLKGECSISLVMLQWKRALSRIEGRMSWFISSCSRNLGFLLSYEKDLRDPLLLPQESQVSIRVERASRDSSPSVQGPRSSSGAESTTSGFHSSADLDLGVSMEFPQGSQASSHV